MSVEVAAPMQHEKSGNMVEAAVDVFDTDGFDPILYINKMFPSGNVCECCSLSGPVATTGCT